MGTKVINQQKIKVALPEIKRLVGYTLACEGIKNAVIEVSILLTDNKIIKELNRIYLNRYAPTDVISFPMWEGPFYNLHPELLGDIAVSVEQARLEARKRHKNFQNEFNLYVIHGLLHLLGYKDDIPCNAKRMHKRCMAILRKWIGIRRKT